MASWPPRGAHDHVLAHFLRAGLHHHEAVLAARDDDVESGDLALRVARVDDEGAVHVAHRTPASVFWNGIARRPKPPRRP